MARGLSAKLRRRRCTSGRRMSCRNHFLRLSISSMGGHWVSRHRSQYFRASTSGSAPMPPAALQVALLMRSPCSTVRRLGSCQSLGVASAHEALGWAKTGFSTASTTGPVGVLRIVFMLLQAREAHVKAPPRHGSAGKSRGIVSTTDRGSRRRDIVCTMTPHGCCMDAASEALP